MQPDEMRLPLSPPQHVDAVTAALWPAARPRTLPLLLAHGAGSDRRNPLLTALAAALAAAGTPVVVFNYPFTEAGRRRPDPAARLERAHADVADAVRRRLGAGGLVLGGRSMGGRIASHLAAGAYPCAGLLFLGYPLHRRARAGGAPEQLRDGHWPRVRVPALFVQGDRDALCDLGLLAAALPRLAAPHELVVVRGADHGFALRQRDGRNERDVVAEIAAAAASWLRRVAPADGTGA